MTSWNDRLKQVMQEKGVLAADLVRATGLSPAGIKKWLDGATLAPRYDDVIKTCRILNVSPEWLMDGVGAAAIKNSIKLDLIDIKGSCGTGIENFEEIPQIRQLLVSPEWFSRHFSYFKPGNIKIISSLGDSMSPDIEDGDAVFLDTSDTSLIRDGIYAVLIDSELFIKRVQRAPGKLIFISSNPVYTPFEVHSGDGRNVRFLGRVVKSMRLLEL